MTYLTLFEKLKILFDLLIESKYILIFIGLFIILTVIYSIKKISSKKYLLLTTLSLILVFIICIVTNYKVLSSTFNNFTTLFFTNIYFPSIYVYIGIIITSLILFITSIINKNKRRINKIIDIILFIVNTLLLIVILNIIAKNKIDIFSVASLYTNKSLVAILEISMGIFIIWVIFHIIIYITNSICDDKKVVYVVNKLRIKNNKIRLRDNKLLLKKNKKLIKENKGLLESRIKLVEENKILFQNNNKLNEKNKLLYQTNIKINEEKNILIIDRNKLCEENKILLEDNKKVKEENSFLVDSNNKLSEENNILINNNNKLFEENKILLKDNKKVKEENDNLTISNNKLLDEKNILKEIEPTYYADKIAFNDILNGTLEVTYYETDIDKNDEYNMINPQEIYERNYNTAVEEYQKQNMTLEIKLEPEEMIPEEILKDESIILNNEVIVENISNIEEVIADDKLSIETISVEESSKEEIINEIIKEETIEVSVEESKEEKIKDIYTLEDYKQIIKMLNNLKSHSKNSNINIDEAVTISLINNYSVDDCLKFKEILESNLN